MKRIILSLAAITLVFLVVNPFTACKKKDGVYKPKEKISKIYYEVIRYDSTEINIDSSYKIEKTLKEIWRWDKKKLMQIESSDRAWSWDFIYKGQQCIKIESGDWTINFSYRDKSDLEKIEVTDEQGRTSLTITVNDRSDDKITRLTYLLYTYTETQKSMKDIVSELHPVMRVILGDHVGEIVLSDISNNNKRQKGTTVSISTATAIVNLTYQGNNLTQAKWTYENNPIPEIYTYTYDNKVNPYYRAISLMATQDENNILSYPATYNLFPCSENNVLSVKQAIDTVVTESTYKYDYNSKDFPTKQIKKEVGRRNNMERTKYIDHYIYHYEYED
ncbi:MAG: hypothetical protein LBE13_03100 [Bacteroidales bacterium]|jgi:hypothetical protein|nr:hypothetical protein [Bacteroidales bacterium]